MTVEAVVALPVMLAIALISMNALLFFDACAVFDRQFRFAVTTYATSPSHLVVQNGGQGLVQSALDEVFDADYVQTSVSVSGASPGWVTYSGKIDFTPTLFGRPFSGNAFGVSLPPLSHSVSLTIDPYKPGALL